MHITLTVIVTIRHYCHTGVCSRHIMPRCSRFTTSSLLIITPIVTSFAFSSSLFFQTRHYTIVFVITITTAISPIRHWSSLINTIIMLITPFTITFYYYTTIRFRHHIVFHLSSYSINSFTIYHHQYHWLSLDIVITTIVNVTPFVYHNCSSSRSFRHHQCHYSMVAHHYRLFHACYVITTPTVFITIATIGSLCHRFMPGFIVSSCHHVTPRCLRYHHAHHVYLLIISSLLSHVTWFVIIVILVCRSSFVTLSLFNYVIVTPCHHWSCLPFVIVCSRHHHVNFTPCLCHLRYVVYHYVTFVIVYVICRHAFIFMIDESPKMLMMPRAAEEPRAMREKESYAERHYAVRRREYCASCYYARC